MHLQFLTGQCIIFLFQGIHDGLMFITGLILKGRIQVGEQAQTLQLKRKGILQNTGDDSS